MKLPVQGLALTRVRQLAVLLLVASLSGCVASVTSVARDTFLKSYTCPPGQLTVRPIEDGTGASCSASAEVCFVEVVGCGHDDEYQCQAGSLGRNVDGVHVEDGYPTSCSPRERIAYEATDGSIHEAWGDAAQGGAAIASAAHDLPCERASIVAIDNLTLEGCGQRVTYKSVDRFVATTPPGRFRITTSRRYTLVGRVPLPGAATPSPAPSSAPTSAGSGCSKDTDCKGDRA
jgi:hypothetical protein